MDADMRASLQTWMRNALEGVNGVSVTVTYTQQTARTFAPTTGATTPTTTGTSMTASRLDFGTNSKKGLRDEQPAEWGPVAFLIEKRRLDDAGVTEPSKRDRITEGSTVYEVSEYSLDGGRLFWTLKCVKAGS